MVEQEQAYQAIGEDAGVERRDRRRKFPAQRAGALRALVHGRELPNKLLAAPGLAREIALELVDIFALERHDLERAQRRAVAGDRVDEAVQKGLDRRQRVRVG